MTDLSQRRILVAGAKGKLGEAVLNAQMFEVTQANLLPIAQQLSAQSCQRIVLVSPLSAWQQATGTLKGIADETELAISQLPINCLVILRPSAATSTKQTGSSLLKRFANGYLQIFNMLLPSSTSIISAQTMAKHCLSLLRQVPDGVHLLNNEDLLCFKAKS